MSDSYRTTYKVKSEQKDICFSHKRLLIEYSPIIELVERIETDRVCSANCKQ